jgi:hypothetical protein
MKRESFGLFILREEFMASSAKKAHEKKRLCRFEKTARQERALRRLEAVAFGPQPQGG